jgi:hypothetical protein
LVAEDADPLGPLEAAAPPPEPVLLDAEPPLMPGLLDEDAPPAALLVPPVAPGPELDESGELDEAELEEPGDDGAVAVDEEDEPPGTMTVSFSFVTVEVGPPPGTTAVVSLRSQAERARAAAKINR